MTRATTEQLAFVGLESLQQSLDTAGRDLATGDLPLSTVSDGPKPDLTDYDVIIAGLSGKDAHAMLEVLTAQARRARVFDRVFTVHADMGPVEWPEAEHRGRRYPSNRELAARTSLHYGIPAERHIETRRVVTGTDGIRRPQTLLEHIAMWGKFPDPARRWCTSDAKVSKIRAALTPIVRQLRGPLGRPVRILNVTGVRAEESARRAARSTYHVGYANTHRQQDEYLPVHHMSTTAVRELVDASGLDHHWAYDSEPGADDWDGMSRLSCSLCIMGAKRDHILAARRRPRLAALYYEVEQRIGHTFTVAMPMSRIMALASMPGGPQPGIVLDEQNPEFDELEAAVRAQLITPTRLPASTEFTAVPTRCVGC